MLQEKDQFDAHYKLAEFYRQVRDEGTQHQWKVTLGIWALLAAGIVSAGKLPPMPLGLVIAFLLAILVFHWLWALDNFRLRNRESDKSYEHLSKASDLAGLNKVDPSNRRMRDIYPFFEAAGTTILCVVLGIMYGLNLWDAYSH